TVTTFMASALVAAAATGETARGNTILELLHLELALLLVIRTHNKISCVLMGEKRTHENVGCIFWICVHFVRIFPGGGRPPGSAHGPSWRTILHSRQVPGPV